jgi:hypothetical protein
MGQNHIGISKRAKGFALKLTNHHYFIIRQIYPWLQSIGATDKETDEALPIIPNLEINNEDLEEVKETGKSRTLTYKNGFYRMKTIRVRANNISGIIKLLKLTAAYGVPSSQASTALLNRAKALSSISSLDMLADAAR